MSFDPWGSDENSLETDNPLTQGAKKVGDAVVKPTVAQLKANQTFVDQLYGNVSSSDSADPSSDIAGSAQPSHGASNTPAPGQLQGPAMPGDESKLAETRQKLEALHHKNYYEPLFGEAAQQKRIQQAEQDKQMKEQEEEEEKEREEQERQQQSQDMGGITPQGKAVGKPGGQKAVMKPLSVMQSQTKTESNRGSTG